MISRLPVLLCIDVEPDLRAIDPRSPAQWRGFEAMVTYLETLRPRLERATGAPARFSWFVRLDPQVERAYGSADWVLRRYPGLFERIRGSGDEIGLHVHTWRWDAIVGSWMIDLEDPDWIEHCVRFSAMAFADTFGRTARSFRLGDGWMSDGIIELLESLGVEFDVTLEAGRSARPAGGAGERASGMIPDYTRVPRRIYRPAPSDFRRRGHLRRRGLWMIPVTTGRVGRPPSRWLASLTRLRGSARRIGGRPWGKLRAHPEPIEVARAGELAATRISWVSYGTTAVEVRVGAAAGPLFARSPGAGEAMTGVWVRDGMLFFLQDVSNAGSPPCTLDVLRVGVEARAQRSSMNGPARRLGRGAPAIDWTPLNLAYDPVLLAGIVDRVLDDDRSSHLTIVTRTESALFADQRVRLEATLEHVLSHPQVARLAFDTPAGAVALAGLGA